MISLTDQVRHWLPPRATDTGKGERTETFVARMGDRTENCFQSLVAQVCRQKWPTASARDWKDTPGMARQGTNPDGSERKRDDMLARRVYSKQWPTPTKSDGTGGRGNSPGRGGDNLRTAIKHPTPQASDGKGATSPDALAKVIARGYSPNLPESVQGSLNPNWVCWLMGWPIGWEDLERDHPEYMDWSEDPADVGKVPRVCTGTKHRAARLKVIGNGQCPQAMVLAWDILNGAYHV